MKRLCSLWLMLTCVWPDLFPSGTVPPSPSPAAAGDPHIGGCSAAPPVHPPAAAPPHEASAASLAPVCASRSASGSLAPILSEDEDEQRKIYALWLVRPCLHLTGYNVLERTVMIHISMVQKTNYSRKKPQKETEQNRLNKAIKRTESPGL